MEKAQQYEREGGIGAGLITNEDPLVAIPDSEVLIRRTFLTNSRLGCEMLFRLYYQPLCSHAIRFVGSREIAQDLVSDMFCRFHENQTFCIITTSYRAYLYKTIRHQAYNYLRWESKRNTDLAHVSKLTIGSSLQPDCIAEYEELYQDVENAINSLPPQRRKIYLMNRFDGKKYLEIAQELHLAPKTVEVQIRKASHFLRDLLRDKWMMMLLTTLIAWTWIQS